MHQAPNALVHTRFGLAWHDLTFRFVPLLPFLLVPSLAIHLPLQVDLKHEGESDEVIYQYTGEGSPTPNKYALDEIYPEKFDDAAGQPSKTLFAKNARMRMVEYFPEKDIKAYLGGEADELMFGHSVSGYGMSNDQYEVREVPDLIPQQFMSAAGLTSKELQRNVLKEKINRRSDTKIHVSDQADEVVRQAHQPLSNGEARAGAIHGWRYKTRRAWHRRCARRRAVELRLQEKIQQDAVSWRRGGRGHLRATDGQPVGAQRDP